MLKITKTTVKSIKLGYELIIEFQIIHFCPKSDNEAPWAKYRVTRYLVPGNFF